MMAANNYFGFTHGGTQYGAATAGAAYGGQTGYAVAPAATAAGYGTQRAAATGYDTAYQAAAATQGTYAAAHAHAHAAAHHVAAAQSAYDASKTYYQQAAAAYPAAAPPPAAYEAAATPKPAYTTPATYAQGYHVVYNNSQAGASRAGAAAKATAYAGSYPATTAGVATATAYPAAQQYATPAATTHPTHTTQPAKQGTVNTTSYSGYDTALYNAATMYVAQQNKGGGGGGWQSYKKVGVGGGPGGAPGGQQRRPKPPPKAQQLHYCDVCRISCAGPQTYREHLEGQKHKKKEASVKLAAATAGAAATGASGGSTNRAGGGGSGGSALRCELCDVTCTGADAYAAHVRGMKHQKVVKLHTILGKPIPSQEPKVLCAAKKTVAGTPKINFIASGGLSTVAGTNANASSGEGGTETAEGEAAEEADTEPEIQPVGQDYIEEIKGDDGKVLSFNCKLCDCRFNDPNAKEMHMKGRRHRLQYKKKVQPDLVVDVKPSMRQRKLAEQKAQRMLVREELWARRRMHECSLEEEERLWWEERRREECEYAEWCRRGPPRPHHLLPVPHHHHAQSMGMQLVGGRRVESADDRHVMAKHAAVYPGEAELADIQRIVSHTERALKAVSDSLAEQAANKNKPGGKAGAKIEKKDEAKDEKGEHKEDGRDNQLFSFMGEGETTAGVGTAGGPASRALKGVMRVGLLAKGLLLRGDRDVRLAVLCCAPPTVTLLKRVAAELPLQLKMIKISEDIKYKVELVPAEGAVTVTDGNVNVLVSLTSPVMREPNDGGGGGADVPKRDDKDVLPRQKCLDALAALRHAKWFQARAATLQSCVIIIRIMRDLCRRIPNWTPLHPWAMELLVEKVVSSANVPLSPGEALRRLMEAVAGGILLEQGPGLLDPCEKDTQDALGNLPPQKREDLTASAQQFLRQIAFRQIHKVLDMEPLPIPKRPTGPWKFPRKRRRSNNENESDGKMVKTETAEKMDTSESK